MRAFLEKNKKTGFLKQAPNVFTVMKNGGERCAHYKSALNYVNGYCRVNSINK